MHCSGVFVTTFVLLMCSTLLSAQQNQSLVTDSSDTKQTKHTQALKALQAISHSNYESVRAAIINETPYAIFYEHCGYKGDAIAISANQQNNRDIKGVSDMAWWNWNNKVSSIRVFNGAILQLYEHPGFKGTYRIVEVNAACLLDQNFDNSTASFKWIKPY